MTPTREQKLKEVLGRWLEGWNGDTCHFKDHIGHLDLASLAYDAGLEEAEKEAFSEAEENNMGDREWHDYALGAFQKCSNVAKRIRALRKEVKS